MPLGIALLMASFVLATDENLRPLLEYAEHFDLLMIFILMSAMGGDDLSNRRMRSNLEEMTGLLELIANLQHQTLGIQERRISSTNIDSGKTEQARPSTDSDSNSTH